MISNSKFELMRTAYRRLFSLFRNGSIHVSAAYYK